MNLKDSLLHLWQYTLLLWLLLAIAPKHFLCAQGSAPLSRTKSKLAFEHLNRENGLPTNAVVCMLQDSRGFMWFGTPNGLVRYDGYELKTYKNVPRDQQSLSDNRIQIMYEDRREKLWIGTAVGLNSFDPSAESFTSYLPIPGDSSSLSDSFIKAIYEDQQGQFWVGTQSGGLNLMDREKETFSHYLPDPDQQGGFVSNAIFSIVEVVDQPDLLWVGTSIVGSGHAQFNTTSRKFLFNSTHTGGSQKGYHWVTATIYRSPTNEVWLGTYYGLDLYDDKKEAFITYNHIPADSLSLSYNQVTSIYEDRDGLLWIGTFKGGLNLFDRQANVFHHYQSNPNNPKRLSSNEISSIYQDKSGMFWIGTNDEGVSYANKNPKRFQYPKAKDYRFLQGKHVSAIYEDCSGGHWIGMGLEGLYYFDQEGKTPQYFRHQPGHPQSLSGDAIVWVNEDQEGRIWIGANNRGLNRFDPQSGEIKIFQHDPANPNSLGNNHARAFLQGEDGTIWVGHAEGLQTFDPATETFHSFPLFEKEEEHKFIACLYEDRSGIIWIGTDIGLFGLNPKTGMVRRFYAEKQEINTLNGYPINVISEDSYGNIWAGAKDGLNKMVFTGGGQFEDKTISVRLYTEKEGLPSNHISGILEDDKGQLWISTWNGLSLFKNPQHKPNAIPHFKHFDVKDGLHQFVFAEAAFFKNSRGEMFFGGNEGVDVFHPDSILDNPFVPPVVITSFKMYDIDVPDQSALSITGISEKKEVNLSYKNNIFSIGFAALNYLEGHKNQYAYQLVGFNNRWIQLGTEHQVTFTNLDPGTYTFRVKGSNNDGVWNEEPTELKIIITPPWWKRWWAYSIYVLALLFAIYNWRKYELNRQQLKHDLQLRQVEGEKLQELDQMKSHFFANISHEFRTPLTLILGPLEQLIAGKFKGDIAHHYLLMQRSGQRLLQLINQLLDLSKLEAGKMKLQAQYGDLIPWLKGTFYSFESLANRKAIHLKFVTEVDTAFLYVDREKMEQVFNNLLSNAFKFTAKDDTISIKIKQGQSDGFLQIEIQDTGSGIPADQLLYIFDRFYQGSASYPKDEQGSGIGLALTKELVELHKGQIRVESQLGQGTRFIILLPFGKAHLQFEEIIDTATEVYEPDLLTSLDEPSIQVQTATEVIQVVAAEVQAEAENIVLLVEDNIDMRAFISAQLADNYQVIEAIDGQDGMEKAREFIPDLIISDVMMPRVDGLELCDILKKDERTSHIPIILLTSKADIESRLAGLERGADAYLAKPFNQKELLLRSRKLMELRQKLRAQYAILRPSAPAEDKGIQKEDAFLQKTRKIVEQHLSAADFDMDQFSRLVAMSRSQLFRKIKALTGNSPSIYIRTIRLNRAKELLETTQMNVTEIAYEVGFTNPTYFSDTFLENYGVRPSEFRK